MKKTFKTVIIALVALFTLVSCNKFDPDEEKNYTFCCEVDYSLADDTKAKEFVDYIKTFDFFTEDHKYFGKYEDACETASKALSDFVETIDTTPIINKLGKEDVFAIFLLCRDVKKIISVVTFTPENESDV